MSKYERAARLAKRIEAQAMSLQCVRGVPVDPIRRATLSKRYRIALNVIMAYAKAQAAK